MRVMMVPVRRLHQWLENLVICEYLHKRSMWAKK
jgi:hypothetical protein